MWVRFPPGTPVLDDAKPLLSPANRQFDELGLRALERDWAAWPGEPSDDVIMMRSQFNLFYDIVFIFLGGIRGKHLITQCIHGEVALCSVEECSRRKKLFALRFCWLDLCWQCRQLI